MESDPRVGALFSLPLNAQKAIFGSPCLRQKERLWVLPQVCKGLRLVTEAFHSHIEVKLQSKEQIEHFTIWVSRHGHKLRSVRVVVLSSLKLQDDYNEVGKSRLEQHNQKETKLAGKFHKLPQ